MNILLNGERSESSALTIRELLIDRGIDPDQRGIAIALNSEMILRAEWEHAELRNGDAVELITAMQGG